MVRVLTANIYVGNPTPKKAAEKISDLSPHVAALQESHKALDTLQNVLGGYRFAYHSGHQQGKNTVALALKNMDDGQCGVGQVQGCGQVGDGSSTCGKERWMSYQITLLPGADKRRVFIATHFVCGTQNDDGTFRSSEVADRYKTHSARLAELIGAFKGIGWPVIVGADWNYRLKGKIDTAAEAPDWSPYGLARRFDMKYTAHGIDGILWPPQHYALDKTQVIEQSQTGSDHDWFMTYLDPK